MKKKKWNKLVSVLLAMVTAVSLLSGCGVAVPQLGEAVW